MLAVALALLLGGVLVTSQRGHELWREAFSDDGVVITSDVTAAPERFVVTIDRKAHTVTVRHGTTTVQKSLAPGAVPLVDGQWAAYALLAERFRDGRPPAPFQLFLPDRDVSVDATAQLTKTASGRHLTVRASALEVQIDFDAAGAVVHAAVPAQSIVAVPGVAAPPPLVAAAAAVPATVTAEPIVCDSGGARLHGVVWRPAAHVGPLPLVILVAGIGAIDHDDDRDSYRLLAAALAEHGVASLRYDPRGSGMSTSPAHLTTFADLVADAAALTTQARAGGRYSAVYLVGHASGALVALAAGARLPVDGIVSLGGAGRPLADVLRAQLAPQLDAAERAELDRALGELQAGRAVAPLHSSTLRLHFRADDEPLLRQALFADPLALARAQKTPLTIVHGAPDPQIDRDADGRALEHARPDAALVVLPGLGHALKLERSATLAPGVVDAVVQALKR